MFDRIKNHPVVIALVSLATLAAAIVAVIDWLNARIDDRADMRIVRSQRNSAELVQALKEDSEFLKRVADAVASRRDKAEVTKDDFAQLLARPVALEGKRKPMATAQVLEKRLNLPVGQAWVSRDGSSTLTVLEIGPEELENGVLAKIREPRGERRVGISTGEMVVVESESDHYRIVLKLVSDKKDTGMFSVFVLEPE